MSVLKFAEEFTRLIIRYTRTSSPNNDQSNAITPLTDEEIVFTIHHVLHALSIKGFDGDENKNNLLEIPNNANAPIPEISIVNIKRAPNIDNTCRSQDVQSVLDDSSVSDTSLKTNKKGQESPFNTLQNEKKFISRSNPAICVNISRSDTFVREENQKVNTEDVFEDITNSETNLSSEIFHELLSEIRKSVVDIMAKLNNLEQSFTQSTKLSPENTEKLHQHFGEFAKSLFINSHSSPHRTSTANKTTVPVRRSSSAFSKPKTPTSKLFAFENGNISERRKSTGGIGTIASAGKSGESKVGHSNLTSTRKKALLGSSVEFQPKFTKNPKYAHVRSTIPKAISQKKKIQ